MHMRLARKGVYLDVCALGRPYDDQRYHRIAVETLAVVMVISLIKEGRYTLYYSPVHEEELARNSNDAERTEILKLLEIYGISVAQLIDDFSALERRALALFAVGFGFADAFHTANAEAIGASLITCDDALIRKCKQHQVAVWYGTPIDFGKKEGLL